MGDKDRREILQYLRDETKVVWSSEPRDVKKIREKVLGAFRHTGPVVLYAESETREIVDYLWHLKAAAHEGSVPPQHLKVLVCRILDSKADKWRRWYKMEEIPQLMEEVSRGLRNVEKGEDLVELIEAFLLYIGRVNFWLDSAIPWLSISSVFDWDIATDREHPSG